MAVVAYGCIRENRAACPDGLEVRLVYRTPCMSEGIFPDDIRDASIFIFDQNDIFLHRFDYFDAQRNAGRFAITDLPLGTYSLVVWAGELSPFTFSPLEEGQTTSTAARAQLGTDMSDYHLSPEAIYYGMGAKVTYDTQHNSIAINIESDNCQVCTKVVGIEAVGQNPDQCSVRIEDCNGIYDFNNNNMETETHKYRPYREDLTQGDRSIIQTDFNILKLSRSSRPQMIIENEQTQQMISNYDLIDLIEQIPGINPKCDNRYSVEIIYSSMVSFKIIINGWVVVNNDSDLSSNR